MAEATITPVVPGLHRLKLGAVNAYLIEDGRELTLIDSGFPDRHGAILRAIAALGHRPEDLGRIVLTHAHPDHAGSAAALAAATGARTVMHPLDVAVAEGREPPRPLSPAPDLVMRALFAVLSLAKPACPPVRIDETVEDGAELPVAGGLAVIHAPGHCAGQVALLWRPRRVLFAADACCNLLGLRHPIGYEDRAQGLASLRRLAALDVDVACFGHGAPLVGGAGAAMRRRWCR
jgi:glyoxylase-like metal-dependent hydrolase (beta-lactamase superfamily II)